MHGSMTHEKHVVVVVAFDLKLWGSTANFTVLVILSAEQCDSILHVNVPM